MAFTLLASAASGQLWFDDVTRQFRVKSSPRKTLRLRILRQGETEEQRAQVNINALDSLVTTVQTVVIENRTGIGPHGLPNGLTIVAPKWVLETVN